MESTTIAVDLAKDVIELARSDGSGRIIERRRVKAASFSRVLAQQPASTIVMEACGGAHHWARQGMAQGHAVRLLPAQYARAYRRRNKTDAADCAALLEAARNPEILPVPVKTVEQQVIQGLHRLRSQWLGTRTARINGLRGLLRELGVVMPVGVAQLMKQLPKKLETVPAVLREALDEVLREIRELEERIEGVERQLKALTQDHPAVQRLQQVSGIGLLTATALAASVGDARHFRSGRHLAAWLGLTPKEHSSGMTRHLGKISKRGDVYLRMLLTHGARSVLNRATQLQRAGKQLNYLQRWAFELSQRRGHNKATCALANKLARIAWATWRYEQDFDPDHAQRAA